MEFNDYIRALRLPFTAASALPFIAGSFLARGRFGFFDFLLGLIAAVSGHLGANLINDYADSRSGVDWGDKRFYGFFGGSKLIQEGLVEEKFYLRLSFVFFGLGFFSVIGLAFRLKSVSILFYYVLIAFLAFSYSYRPLRFSYRRLGEFVIFLLFGPAAAMGGYFIQTKLFPDAESFLLSLPFGFFTTAILFSNEVPDYDQDRTGNKLTWVSITGKENAFLLYYVLVAMGFISLLANIFYGQLGIIAGLSFLLIPLAVRAGRILKSFPDDKARLMESSRLTVMLQALAGIGIILGIVI